LLVANETVAGDAVHAPVDLHDAEVLVVAPALNGRVAFWSSDEDRARRAAAQRLARSLEALAAAGVAASGHVGDPNPLLAIEDALRTFPAEEIVVVTPPEHRAHWLAHEIAARARARFPHPVHQITAA
jgi:hypothetical protein